MNSLHAPNSWNDLAVFENGIVYNDSWKNKILGSYKNGTIYAGPGLSIMGRDIIGRYESGCIYSSKSLYAVGRISGTSIYSGTNTIFNNTVATFSGNDCEGAAAAALILGLFDKIDKSLNNTTTANYKESSNNSKNYNSFSDSYGYIPTSSTPQESFSEIFMKLIKTIFIIALGLLVAIFVLGGISTLIIHLISKYAN